MLQLAVIFLCCFACYCLWLDFRVRTEFQGTRWALPARVYASPLELYVGKSITKQNLVGELKSLGYQAVSRVWKTGQFSVAGNSIQFINREFSFWDGTEKSAGINVTIVNDAILKLKDRETNNSLSLIRLAPQLIGKIYPVHNEDRVLVKYEDVPRIPD